MLNQPNSTNNGCVPEIFNLRAKIAVDSSINKRDKGSRSRKGTVKGRTNSLPNFFSKRALHKNMVFHLNSNMTKGATGSQIHTFFY